MLELKEKERKTYEHKEKVIKGLHELLRQKEDLIAKITSTSVFNEQGI
jgi:hypothetical protein